MIQKVEVVIDRQTIKHDDTKFFPGNKNLPQIVYENLSTKINLMDIEI